MAGSDASRRSALQQERRRLFLQEVPGWYCPHCTALTYDVEKQCFDCATTRPEEGWPALEDCGDPWLGRIIANRYLVTRHVGDGHSGRVYRADSRVIPRSFAIKIMELAQGADLRSGSDRRRLDREVEALASLRNPHIVSFYDVLEARPNSLAFVMDYIDGRTIEQVIHEEGPMSIRRASALLRQLANGVYEAHRIGLIHRDLKPENLMIERLPAGDDFLRVLDFGIVWMRGGPHMTHGFIGTPLYASPEQARGREVDERSDVYAVGAIYFFMLTGKPPFEHSNAIRALQAHVNEPVPRLRDVAGRHFPQEIEALVQELLAKEPKDRPSSLSEIIERLDRFRPEILDFETRELSEPSQVSEASALGLEPSSQTGLSPVMRFGLSDVSQLSEATIVGPEPRPLACGRQRYVFVQGDELVLTEVATSHQRRLPLRVTAPVCSLATGGSTVLLGLEDGTILHVDLDGRTRAMFQDPRRAPITALALDHAGRVMIAGSASGRIYFHRAFKKDDAWTRLGGVGDPVEAITVNATGDQIGIARGGFVQVMNVGAGHTPALPIPVEGPVKSLAFSPDDYLFAVLTEDGKVSLDSVLTGQEFMTLESTDPGLETVTFSSQNNLMGLFVVGDRVTFSAIT